ncbi:uncharacterized protein EV422DRAFT_275647 [Fimicolochytrium jonesii]|uniref:uncharacterized protein n=1 Tax=Fimicolochytrium jonesii TaxID=1396493 RepID=UPI0022FEF61C|nr:uncharacterized protein EV422DRAFT_275647 [Fimicolochytrium jonesii]KAI8816699.1 hypothetical protein EV422DRAFT_275647 [Fimicolochytrium jonesii]
MLDPPGGRKKNWTTRFYLFTFFIYFFLRKQRLRQLYVVLVILSIVLGLHYVFQHSYLHHTQPVVDPGTVPVTNDPENPPGSHPLNAQPLGQFRSLLTAHSKPTLLSYRDSLN